MLIKLIFLLATGYSIGIILEDPTDYETALAIKQGLQFENLSYSIAFGVNSYKELVKKSKIFLDNTLYIREVYHKHGRFEIMDTECRLTLYLVPRKWGRTMILDMLKTFLEIPMDKDGNKVPKESTSSYKLFHDGEIVLNDGSSEKLERPLLISKIPRVMSRCLCQIPVIYISFKSVVGDSYEMVHSRVCEAIREAFEQHKYMIKSLALSNSTGSPREAIKLINKFQRILNSRNETFLEPQDIADRIHFLSRILHNHFGRKPFLLLDDYDTPFSSVLRSKNFPVRDADEILQFMRELIRKIFDDKRTPDLHQAIAMGMFQLDFTDVYDPFCRIVDITLQKNPIGEYFGFKEKDVKSLFALHNISKQLSEQAHQWYVGRKSIFSKGRFYNPLSIANFVNRRHLDNYRNLEENQQFIDDVVEALPPVRSTLLRLLSKKSFEINSATVKNFNDMSILNAMRQQDYKWPPNEFFFYLYANGYFNADVKIAPAFQPSPYISFKLLLNKEIYSAIAQWMISYYEKRYNIDDTLLLDSAIDLLNFLQQETALTTSLEKSLKILYRTSRGRCSPREYQSDILRAIFNCVTLKMQCIDKFERDVYYEKTVDCDITIHHYPTEEGCLIDFPTNQPEEETDTKRALDVAKQFKELGGVKIVKFVGRLNIKNEDEDKPTVVREV